MTRAVRQKYLLLLCLSVALVLFYHVQKELNQPRLENMIFYESEEDLGKRDPKVKCVFPLPHPFDPSILEYIKPASPISCLSRQGYLTFIDEQGLLRFNKTELQLRGYDSPGDMDCYYREIFRKPQDDFHYTMGLSVKLTSPVRPAQDFVVVDCKGIAGVTSYTSFHAFAQKVPSVRKFRNDVEVGVAVIGLDSMSRLNTMRQLPRTYRYIRDVMGGVVMLGFNKVGENTYPNVIPILTGSPTTWTNTNYFQNWPFIWNDFKDAGAATMYSEDLPSINMFDFLAEGIKDQPTHHYMRTYWLAAEDSLLYKMSSPYCLGPIPKHKIYFDYIKSFFQTYKESPLFLFSLFNEPTHDYVNTAGAIDEDLQQFLQSSYEEGLFNRTVIVILGDHGNRIDSIRRTPIGQIEDRMPLVSVVLPKWTETVYPEWKRNLEQNRQRLLSSYDLHATFKDVLGTLVEEGVHVGLNEEDIPKHFRLNKGNGKSMLGEVPTTRSCQQAGIPDSFCVCQNEDEKLPPDHALSLKAASAVVNHLNTIIHGLVLCSNHTLAKVENAYLRHLKSGALRVQLMVVTDPGKGLYEATVKFPTNSSAMVNEVLRINRYGTQANCLPQKVLKEKNLLRSVCYCLV